MSKLRFAILHLIIIVLCFMAYRAMTGQTLLPDLYLLSNIWDAMHYNVIAHRGYFFVPTEQSNVAFFPGFPYLWRYTHLNGYGISLLNMGIFAVGMLLLAREYELKGWQIMLSMSLPAMFYMLIPYSEPLFFLFGMFIITGLKKDKLWLTLLGLFLASVTRAAANIFLPSLVLLFLMYRQRLSLRDTLLMALVSVVAVFAVMWLQYSVTGEWFGFAKTQQFWGHHLQWPHFPLRTWGEFSWLDAAGLVAGVAAGIGVLYALYRKFKENVEIIDKDIFFSLCYMAGATAFALALKGGNLFSMNRYIIPTPFFVAALWFVIRNVAPSWKRLGIIFLSIFIFLILFHFFVHIRVILVYTYVTIYLTLYFLLHKGWRYHKLIFILLYIINCFMQAYLLDNFFHHVWVG